jgi:hypothetical protein
MQPVSVTSNFFQTFIISFTYVAYSLYLSDIWFIIEVSLRIEFCRRIVIFRIPYNKIKLPSLTNQSTANTISITKSS